MIELYANTAFMDDDEAASLLKDADYLVNLNMPLDLPIEEIRYYRNMIGGVKRHAARRSACLFFVST